MGPHEAGGGSDDGGTREERGTHTVLRLEAKRSPAPLVGGGVGDGQGAGAQYVEKASPGEGERPLQN